MNKQKRHGHVLKIMLRLTSLGLKNCYYLNQKETIKWILFYFLKVKTSVTTKECIIFTKYPFLVVISL